MKNRHEIQNPALDEMVKTYRVKVCDTVLLALSFLGLIAFIPSFILSIVEHLYGIALIDTIAYMIIIFITFNKKLPYRIKAVSGSTVFYFLGMLLLFLLGPIGAGNLWLLAFALITALTLGERGAVVSLIINVITQISLFVLIRYTSFFNEYSFILEPQIWLIRTVNFIVINTVIVFSSSIFSRTLMETFIRQKRSESGLVDSENRMRSMFEQAPFGMVLIESLTGNILEVNSAYSKLVDLNREELVSTDWMTFTHPEDVQKNNEKLEMLNMGEISSYTLDLRYINNNKSVIWVEMAVTSTDTGDHMNPPYLAMIKDITDQKHAEEEKELLQEQLNQSHKMEALGELTGGIAHDFNNVLTGIISSAQILTLPELNLDAKGLRLTDIIYQSGIRAKGLVEKLTAFARKNTLESINLDVHGVIEDTVAILEQTFNKNIQISLIKDAEKSIINGNFTELQNVIMNLGINASHAMADGGVLTISTDNILYNKSDCELSQFDLHPGEHILISVSDNGSGISEEHIGRIFDPFFTTKSVGKGTGLGLTAVYGMIKRSHGEITVHSQVDGGSCFNLSIPCSELQEIDNISYSDQIVKGSGKILIIDDEENIRISESIVLEGMGFHVETAENGFLGVEIFQRDFKSIDLVLLDMIMPGLSGREVFIKLREIDENCKIIVCSGFSRHEDLHELSEMNLSGFLSKPFDRIELSKLINRVLST